MVTLITVSGFSLTYARPALNLAASPSTHGRAIGETMLSTTSQYAIRALCCLARMQFGELALGRDLSRDASVPNNYLSKIMLVMRNAGLVQATRGAGGGYRLAKPAASIRLIDVVSLFEPAVAESECVLGNQPCSDVNPCGAHIRWQQVRTQLVEFLNQTTIAELVVGKPGS